MNEMEHEYPKIQKVVQEEPEPEIEEEVYDIYNSRNYRNKQKKNWDVKSWFDGLW